jgi:hypothetical protein
MKSGLSIRQAMDRLQIHHWYYARWKKVVTRVDDILQKDEAHPFDISGDIKKLHLGRPSSLTTIKRNLTRSIFELHEQGLQVNTRTVRKEASRLSSDFKNKTSTAKIRSVQRFIKSIGLRHKVSTHVAQKKPQGDRRGVPTLHSHDEEQGRGHGSGSCDQHGSDTHTVLIPLFSYFGEEGSKDCPCPVVKCGHETCNTSTNGDCKWKVVAPYVDFQGENGWTN